MIDLDIEDDNVLELPSHRIVPEPALACTHPPATHRPHLPHVYAFIDRPGSFAEESDDVMSTDDIASVDAISDAETLPPPMLVPPPQPAPPQPAPAIRFQVD